MFKNKTHFIKIFLCLIVIIFVFNTGAYSANKSIINTDNASKGYFSVYYSTSNPAKIKIAIKTDEEIVYHNYDIGTTSNYAFVQGDGLYTITVYQNIRDNLYRRIASKKVNVELEDELSPYLISTYEITFSKEDDIYKKANELCQNSSNPFRKVTKIRDFISENITYDYNLAEDIKSGKIKTYNPKAVDVLKSKKGICYDYAVLFAAMCRSQDIPCDIVKGYYGDTLHAWNKVYINNRWYYIDASAKISYLLKK